MLPLMALVTQQFKVAPVERDVWVMDIRRCQPLAVMNDTSRLPAAFAYAVLR